MDTGRHRGSYHTGNPFGYLGIADRMDNHDKLQRRERTVCFNSAAKVSDSGKLYKAFTDTGILNFMQMFKNTLIIAIFSCIISTAFVLAVSYCMSRMRFRLRKPFMNVALILGMFPGFMAMIAVYYILKVLGLSEGSLIRVALVLVYSGGSGLGFYIAKGFFDTIPKSLEEAAYLDGATRWQSFTRIIIPLSRPIIVYTVLNSFLAPWIDLCLPRLYAEPTRTITQYPSDFGTCSRKSMCTTGSTHLRLAQC